MEQALAQVTVVLIDGQELVRKALRQALSTADVEIVGEAPTGEEGLQLVLDVHPDVVLVEFLLRGLSGLETIQRMSALAPASRILVLTGSQDPHAVIEAILAGASGYMVKDAPPDEIVRATKATAAGECVISSQVAGGLLERIRKRDTLITARSEGEAAATIRNLLTEREMEIFQRLASGKSNQEIADELSLSQNTVKNHIASILGKLQLENRVQAAVQAVRSGIS